MTLFLWVYVATWVTLCLSALRIVVREIRFSPRDAISLVSTPWKLCLFVPAALFVTFAGRFTNDETWDVGSGFGMSALTVATSWWSVGAAIQVLRGKRRPAHLFVAAVVTLFSSSWYYDAYLLLRDGHYSHRWFGNLLLSPIIYLCAGVVLNLEVHDGRLGLACSRPDWPRPVSKQGSFLLFIAALPLVGIAGYVLTAFVHWHLGFEGGVE